MTQQLWVIVPAAGIGRRMGSERPKQYLSLGKHQVIQHALDRLFGLPQISHIYLALQHGDRWWPALSPIYEGRITTVAGGEERQDSVFNGLLEIRHQASADDWVLVHDAARPCVRIGDIEKLLEKVQAHIVGGILAVPVADTLKKVADDHQVQSTVAREQLWRAFTPQLFRFNVLFDALLAAKTANTRITDEASAVERIGLSPLVVEGHSDNIKITRPEDLVLARWLLNMQEEETG